jgi:DNA-binding transcriptional regulator YdaS (Cro superfamily)
MTAQISAWHDQRSRVRVPTVAKTVKLPGPLNERLRRFSFAKGISQQDVIMAAVVGYLEKPPEDVRGLRAKRRRHTRSRLLTSVLKASGGPGLLAKALGVSPQAVCMWKQVPTTKVLAVEEITGIRREILRPDLYDEQGKRSQSETTKEKLLRLADGTQSASELARLCGVSRQRIDQLVRIDGLAIPMKPSQKGPNSITAQARANGLTRGAVYGRLKKMPLDEALAIPLGSGGTPRDPNSINGQARAHGLEPGLVHQRLRALGWPLDRALTTPKEKRAPRRASGGR